MPATIRDVAALAKVSVATASRVLSGSRPVSDGNRRRVLAAAADLGYRRNRVASALRRQVTDTIGLVIPQITNPFFPALVETLEWQLQSSTRQLLLCDSRHDVEVERSRLHALLDHQVDGILISPCEMKGSSEGVRMAGRQVPLVQIDRRIVGDAADWVGVDDSAGLHLALRHVSDMGARVVAFVSSKPTSSSAQLRLEGFLSAVTSLGVETSEPLLGDFTVSWGFDAARMLLQERRLPDAVVCGNDLIAIGLLRQFFLSGVLIPDDVLVIGYDDIPAAELATPPLSTVRQPYDAIVHEAIRLLAERSRRPDRPHQRIAVTPALVIRGSTEKAFVSPTGTAAHIPSTPRPDNLTSSS